MVVGASVGASWGGISIRDLTDVSHLKMLLQGTDKPSFKFGPEVAPFWNLPMKDIPADTWASFTLSHDASWTAGPGITFGLSPSVTCKLEIIPQGPVLEYRPDIQSHEDDAQLPEQPYDSFAYLRMSIDFAISGNVSGSGSVGALGISGHAEGCEEASLVFCHRVANDAALSAAVVQSFEKLVFPFHPSCALDLAAYDIAQVTFKGSFALGLKLSYGFASVGFSAPGVSSAIASATKGMATFNLPSGKVDIGASFAIDYTHEDDFTAFVEKLDGNSVFLYLLRARRDKLAETLGVKAKVKISSTTGVQVDQQKLQGAVSSVAGNFAAGKVSALAGTLSDKLNGKLTHWITDQIKGGVNLGVEWDQQKQSTLLYEYKVAAGNPALQSSWTSFCHGDLLSAVSQGGLVPLPGSGVENDLDHSFEISFNVFNFFHATDKETYFAKSTVYITDTGDIRFLFDVGEESSIGINSMLKKCRIHFMASADSNTTSVTNAAVDLYLELSETNNLKEAARVADTVGLIPPNEQVNQSQHAMAQFVTTQPTGTLNLTCVLKSSAYGRLSCSPFVGNQPPIVQQQDSENWETYHTATLQLIGDLARYIKSLHYSDWQDFNLACSQKPSNATPNRRDFSPTANLGLDYGQAFWEARQVFAPAVLVNEFCVSSASFMNLCEDLHGLANTVAEANTVPALNQLLSDLKAIQQNDLNNMQYAKPTIAALLCLSNPTSVAYESAGTANSFTCTLTLS